MDDLISRQQIYKNYQSICTDVACLECPFLASDHVCRVEQLIESQPYVNTDLHDYSTELWRRAYERGKSEAQRWIPVTEDALPEYGQYCLVTFERQDKKRRIVSISVCYVQKEGFWSDTPFEYRVVAWMLLPEAWKGGTE